MSSYYYVGDSTSGPLNATTITATGTSTLADVKIGATNKLYLGAATAAGALFKRVGNGEVQLIAGDNSNNGTLDAFGFSANSVYFFAGAGAIAGAVGSFYAIGTSLYLATNATAAMVWDVSQNTTCTGTLSFGGAATVNGALGTFGATRGSVTLSGASTTLVTIPAGVLVLGAVARVTTLITAATGTTWSMGTGTLPTDFGTTLAFTANTTVTGANYVTFTGAQMFPAATAIVAVPNLGTFTGGVVECIVYWVSLTAPTS